MKIIPLKNEEPFKSRDVIATVASQPTQGQGINAQDMRQRCRILDALEKSDGDTLSLEDADHSLLARLVNGFQFGAAHPKLLAIIDDVLTAKSPEPVVS